MLLTLRAEGDFRGDMFHIRNLCLIFIVFIPNTVYSAETPVIKPGSFLDTEREKQADSAPSAVTHGAFNASVDAKHLNEAVVGLGTDEDKIITVLTGRTNAQRQEIRKAYENLYHKDLIQDLKDDTSGNFEKIIVALMLEPHEFLAEEVHRALYSILPKEATLAEILCTKSKNELQPIIHTYNKKYNTPVHPVSLRDDIEENIQESFKSFLKNIINEQTNLRADSGVNDDKQLIEKQVNSIPLGLDRCQPAENKVLFDMLSKESFEHIRKISELFQERNANYSSKMYDYVKDYCPEDMLTEAYLTVLYYASSPAEFYAHRLDGAMIGLGTNDDTLIRIIVGRSETDIGEIKRTYKGLFNTTLEYSIEQETSGTYKKTLLKLIDK